VADPDQFADLGIPIEMPPEDLDIYREDAGQRMRLAQIQKKYFPFTQAQLDHTERLERESLEREELGLSTQGAVEADRGPEHSAHHTHLRHKDDIDWEKEVSTLHREVEGLAKEKRYEEALELARRAHDLASSRLGDEHKLTGGAIATLGSILFNIGEYGEGLVWYKEGASCGIQDFYRLMLAGGLRLHEVKQYEEARPYLEEALKGYKQFPQESTRYVRFRHWCAYLLRDVFFLRTYYTPRWAFRPVEILGVLGSTLEGLSQYYKTKECFEEANHICNNWLPRVHPERAVVLTNLGSITDFLGMLHRDSDEMEKGVKYLIEAENISRKTMAKGDRRRALILHNLGWGAQFKSRSTKVKRSGEEMAAFYFEEALKILKVAVGEDDPEFRLVQENLEKLRRKDSDTKPIYVTEVA